MLLSAHSVQLAPTHRAAPVKFPALSPQSLMLKFTPHQQHEATPLPFSHSQPPMCRAVPRPWCAPLHPLNGRSVQETPHIRSQWQAPTTRQAGPQYPPRLRCMSAAPACYLSRWPPELCYTHAVPPLPKYPCDQTPAVKHAMCLPFGCCPALSSASLVLPLSPPPGSR